MAAARDIYESTSRILLLVGNLGKNRNKEAHLCECFFLHFISSKLGQSPTISGSRMPRVNAVLLQPEGRFCHCCRDEGPQPACERQQALLESADLGPLLQQMCRA